MPYLQVDLDAMDAFPDVALMAGITEGEATSGCLKLWRHCWKEKVCHVNREQLSRFFRGDLDTVIRTLEVCGFIDRPASRPDLHVRGSEKRLGIVAAQSESGKKHAKNLKRGTKSPGLPGKEPEGSRDPADRVSPALTSSIQHPASSIKTTTLSGSTQVFEHWKQKLHPEAKAFTGKRKTNVEARLTEGYSADDLCLAVDGCAVTPHNIGQNDKGQRFDDLELICRDATHVDRFISNARSPPKPPPRLVDHARGMVRAQDVDKTEFEKMGVGNVGGL